MIKLRNYLKMDSSALRELLLRGVLPYDVHGQVPIGELPHQAFALNDEPELFDPARNLPFQGGRIEGFILEDGIFWPSAGIVRTQDGRAVRESYFEEGHLALARKQKHLVRFPLRQAGVATAIGHMFRNYFHKHIDSIPRLYGLQHPALRALPRIDLYLDPRYSAAELEIIRALIPDNVRIQMVDFSTRLRAERYIFLPFLSQERTGWSRVFTNCAGYLPDEYIAFYRRRIKALWGLPDGPGGKRIYVSRRRAAIRRLTNEEEVVEALRPYGFERVEMEGLSLREQAHLFATAEIVVAQHGAALTNLLYGQPGQRVVEIFSSKKLKIYETLARVRRMPYFPIAVGTRDKNNDVSLPLSMLENTMEEVMSYQKTT